MTDSDIALDPVPARPNPTPPSPPPEPLNLPDAFWPAVDHFLHHPEAISLAIREDRQLPRLIRFFTLSIVVLGCLYGGVMGLLGLLQGHENPLWEKLAMPVATGIKVPALYLLTLAIIFPPVYVMNAFSGGRMGFRKVAAIMLFGTTVTLVLLSSFATVALFFSLTSGSASFVKMLHSLFFIIAGSAGWVQMLRCLRWATAPAGGRPVAKMPGWLTALWIALYAFVGSELAWVMRPYFGTPGHRFELFRPRGGNLFEAAGGWMTDSMNSSRHHMGVRVRR